MGNRKFKTNVVAIRLYYGEDNITSIADIKFHDGTFITRVWNLVTTHEEIDPYIDSYTLWYDERPKRDWDEWPGDTITTDDFSIKLIMGSPYDVGRVLNRLAGIGIPYIVESFGSYEESFELFKIRIRDNHISGDEFRKTMESLHKLPFNAETEHLYVKVRDNRTGETKTLGISGCMDIDYVGIL